MATLEGQTIANSYEQLLHVDNDGGGTTTTLREVKDGDNGTTFGFKISNNALSITSTNQLQFGDTGTYIYQSADGVLDLVSDTEIEINATTVDMNANLDLDGTSNISGVATFQTGIVPDASDSAYLGTSSLEFSDLFLADGAVIALGDGGADVTLTHVADTGIQVNSTNKIMFHDTSQFIYASSNAILGLGATDEIDLTATTIDINGAVAMDGAMTGGTNITISGELDAATLDISGNADIDGTANLDNTDIDGTLVVDGTNISLDSTSTLNIDNSNTTNGITIGTATSSVPISVGHSTSETTVGGNLTVGGVFRRYQGTQATTDDGTAVISTANVLTGIVQCTPTADRSKATDTASNFVSTLGLTANDDSFDFSLINLATDGSSHITITAGSGVTLVGCMVVSAQDLAEDAFTSGVGMFRIRRTGSSACTMFRIA